MTVLNAAVRHKVDCFVFTSSIAFYGENQLPMREDLTPQPEDPYGVAKYAVEPDLQAAHEMFDHCFPTPQRVRGVPKYWRSVPGRHWDLYAD